MNEPIFILGTGGHARDVADIVAAIGRRPVFVTRDVSEVRHWAGRDQIELEENLLGLAGADFAIGIGDNALRARVAAQHSGRRFPALIHPDTSFGRNQRRIVEAAAGATVFAGVRFGSGIQVGTFCTFNLNATISHDCSIGNFVNVSPGANIAGNVCIGDGAWIGIGAAINQGGDDHKLKIGTNTMIGSGTVVLGNCEPDTIYVGVPARKVE